MPLTLSSCRISPWLTLLSLGMTSACISKELAMDSGEPSPDQTTTEDSASSADSEGADSESGSSDSAGWPYESLQPWSLFAPADGVTPNAASTVDVGTLEEIIEHDRLFDENQNSACDHYFGWNGVPANPTEENKILCGKYQFLYEHFSTMGLPRDILEFNHRWFTESFGDELEKLGYIPDPHPRRQVTDVFYAYEGDCLEWSGDSCVRVSESDGWAESFTYGEDNLPVGLVYSPKEVLGFDSTTLTCAYCHVGQAPDGRYMIGLANPQQSYGTFMIMMQAPIQATTMHIEHLYADSLLDDVLGLFGADLTELEQLQDMTELLTAHPQTQFFQEHTQWSPQGEGFEDALRDMRRGTCFSRSSSDQDLLSCDLSHLSEGSEESVERAQRLKDEFERRYGTVYTSDWTLPFEMIFGDTYCLPWPLTPGMLGHSSDVQWSQFFPPTLDSMRDQCQGLRWDSEYIADFGRFMIDMAGVALFAEDGAMPMLTLNYQDAFMRLKTGTMDFVTVPMVEDNKWTVSKVPSNFGIPSLESLEEEPGMYTENGEPSALLGLMGGVADPDAFVPGFIMISQSVDPRYVECETEGIVGNWSATPDGSCQVIPEHVAPIAAYLESLKTPHPVESPEDDAVQRGLEVFEASCVSCHSGPQGQTEGVFMFAPVEEEGLAEVPVCEEGVRSVEYTDAQPSEPVFNRCHPRYDSARQDIYPRVLGWTGTDPAYSQIFNPDPITGMTSGAEELDALAGATTQGIKGQRLSGAHYRTRLLHHGQVDSLESLLCMEGTPRETEEGRSWEPCLYYDLDSEGALEAYQQGAGRCAQHWKPQQGHLFGCDLSSADREDLIAYLKTL